MQNIPIWKPILIAAVLGMCAWSLYPPSQKLKPGLDLQGGTTLIYQVNVPSEQDPRDVIDQTIETLRKRVDPNGVMNLIWRRQAGNRIEIQMPPPAPYTQQLRNDYLQMRDQLLESNISKRDLESSIRADPAQRHAAMDQLAGGDPYRQQLLQELAKAYDDFYAAREPYEQAQDALRAAQVSLKALGTDVDEDKRKQLQEQIDALDSELIAKTRAFVEARRGFETAQNAVLGNNIDPNELEAILSLPQTPSPTGEKDKDGKPVGQRQAQLDRFIAQHPDRADQIRAVADVYTQYSQVKQGPLDDPNDLIALLKGSGVLEFRIAAPSTLSDLSEYRDQLRTRGPRAGSNKPFRWFVIDDLASFVDEPAELRSAKENPESFFANSRNQVAQVHGQDYYILLANTPDASMTQAQPGWKLSQAFRQPDDRGFPAVGFELNRIGGQLMGELTGAYKESPMAIVLDGRVISTPTIRSQIHDKGSISGGRGGFTPQEMQYMLRTLNAGSLQGQLSDEPIYIKKFGPQLGQDNLERGLKAAIWALIAVAILMAGYYFFCGFVADFALAANMVVILGVMAMFGATFTLPGIAGIVLTIGMAVDANVLIFERIREELGRKADLTTSVRLGYGKALATIIDANLTTLITCVVLFYTATAEVKGFAVTLMAGILATMFTALFCTRVILDYYVEYGGKNLATLPALVPAVHRWLHPNIDWVAKRGIFFVVSLAMIVGGVVLVASRGGSLLDIEFRSGTAVSFDLAEGKTMTLEQVRGRLDTIAGKSGLANLASDHATVVTVGQADGSQASGFSIATLETDPNKVSSAIKEGFEDVLDAQRPIAFYGMGAGYEAPSLATAPVYPIYHAQLGDNIDRPDVVADVTDYLGGVAVLIENMDPPATTKELEDRVESMRLQPGFDNLGYRPSTVIGLDLAAAGVDGTPPMYRSAVLVSTDGDTNYLDAPETFNSPEGLAVTEWRLVHDALRRDTSLESVSNFSSQVSKTMQQQAIVALVLSLLAVVAYIWLRFGSLRFGLAAIVALVHDVTIALGIVAAAGYLDETAIGQALMLNDFKINLALVAALLTIVGYSLNDTIIVFDRIRENRGRLAVASPSIINDSINQTISRTIMTSGTTMLAVLTLYVFGGEGVHGFAFTMLLGVIVGTYSSVAIAAPILLMGSAVGDQPVKSSADVVDTPVTATGR